MEVIIWKLCTSKALGIRQRTVMVWKGRDCLASNVHFVPFFLQENPVISVLSWQCYESYHPRASLCLPGTPGSNLGRWGWEGRGLAVKTRQETQTAQGWEEAAWTPPYHPVSPGLWVLPLPVRLAQQPQNFMPLTAWEQGLTDARGHPFHWQNPSLFCLHRRRWNVTPVPDFLHQKCTISSVPVQLLCVLGQVKGNKILPFAIMFCVGIEQDCWWVKKTCNGYFGLLMRKGAEWPK